MKTMTLAERRARRFAELVGGEAKKTAWDSRVYLSPGKQFLILFFEDDGQKVLFESLGDVEIDAEAYLIFADVLRQVLAELPDEWTEEDGGSRSDALAAMSHSDTIRSGYVERE